MLTSAVVASLVTSITNIVIAVFNNRRLKLLEKEKRKNELNIYRYTHLFDLLLKLDSYNTPFETEGRTVSQIASERLINGYIDSHKKFDLLSPLLDEKYKTHIVELNSCAEYQLKELFKMENELETNPNEELMEKYNKQLEEFFGLSANYSMEVENAARMQLVALLKEGEV